MMRTLIAVSVMAFGLGTGGVLPAQQADQQEPTLEEQLADCRTRIAETQETIGSYTQMLEEANASGNQSRSKRLRADIDELWEEVDGLKELEEYLEGLLAKRDSGSGGDRERPKRPGSRPFDRDPSTGSEKPRDLGIIADDDDVPIPREELDDLPRPKEHVGPPTRSGGGAAVGGKGDRQPRDDGRSGRPQRAGGPPRERDASDGEDTLTSDRLRKLEESHAALVKAGEDELAASVMEKIERERQALKERRDAEMRERQERERRDRENKDNRNRDGAGGNPPVAEPGDAAPPRTSEGEDSGIDEEEMTRTIREINERLKKLEEENRRLREENNRRDKDGGERP